MEYNERKDKKNIAYLLIGILTLIIATTGATFAYFTATDDEGSVITGNMATISFSVDVEKMTTVDNSRGLIPMSNSMVESALTKNAAAATKGICVDDNGNAVCQVYKITTTNDSSASMLVDGYVTLTGGSGTATDLVGSNNATTMRWAQAFCDETNNVVSNCTTAGITTTSAVSKKAEGVEDPGIKAVWGKVQNTATTEEDGEYGKTGHNKRQILTSGITTKALIAGSEYDVINTNFIRISDHKTTEGYTQTSDITSALVYNEFLTAKDDEVNSVGGSNSEYTDSQVYYIVIWLSETGTNQTVAEEAGRINFFAGTVKFISAQGSEVTATFSDYSSVRPDTLPPQQ